MENETSKNNTKNSSGRFKLNPKIKVPTKDYGEATVDALKRASIESIAKQERYEKIYKLEREKWSHGMGSKLRSEIPEDLHETLDACIAKSQIVAREACQTPELTEAYLKIKNER